MARQTRRQLAYAQKDAWTKALRDGRVIRFFGNGDRLVSYPTIEMRDAELTEAIAAGIEAEIIQQG